MIVTTVYQKRVSHLMKTLASRNIDVLFSIKHPYVNKENVRYLSGFTGSSAHLIISERHRILVTDDRYTAQATHQCPDFTVIDHHRKPEETIRDIFAAHSIKKVGYESQGLTIDLFNGFKEKITAVQWVPTSGAVEALRAVKQPEEIQALETAAHIAVRAFHHIVERIRPGVTEKELALEMEWHMRQNGADGTAFHIILVSGQKSAFQHGVPSDKQIEPGDFVVIDFGALYQGYHSDITRTVAVGPVSEKHRNVYHAVQKAQALGVEMIRTGAVTGEIYDEVQGVIAKEGFGEFAGTGMGHSVGLTLWEDPMIRAGGKDALRTGNVLTMEPGIYIPQWGGVRIEDMVVVEKNGCRILSDLPKDLMVL